MAIYPGCNNGFKTCKVTLVLRFTEVCAVWDEPGGWCGLPWSACDAYWNPRSDRLFSDRVFGVGWAVNLYRAKTLMEQVFGRLMGSHEALTIRMTVRSEGSAKKPDVKVTQD